MMAYNLHHLCLFANILLLTEPCTTSNSTEPPCPKNEHFVNCGTLQAPTCSNPNPPSPSFSCVARCSCIAGYIRAHENGSCIPLDWCPKPVRCSANQIIATSGFGCPICSAIGRPIFLPVCRMVEEYKCYCKEGYCWDDDHTCSEIPCPRNQTRRTAGFDCLTCRNDLQVNCKITHQNKCYCNTGYVRSSNDRCILRKDCPKQVDKCPRPSEIPQACKNFCPPTCADRNPIECPSLVCEPNTCKCAPGYIRRGKDGPCIRNENCPTDTCPRPSEIPQACKNFCPPTCADRNPIECPSLICEPNTCECAPGYIRREKDGPCIRKENCPTDTCPRPSEIPQACKNFCPPTCADPNPVECPSFVCQPNTCQCAPGYIRRERDGPCIPKINCPCGPPNITCGLNEVPERCHEPCPPTCSDRNRAPCPTLRCSEGCGCAPGFIRLRDGGDCIPEKRCPIVDPPLCPANQTYQTSGYDCQTCRVDIRVKCAEINEHKCYCNIGYVRLQNGNCVNSEDCPDDEKCDSKRHWIFSRTFSRCGNCNNNCASIGQPPKPCPCSPGCICKDPYVDNGQHTCVLMENCPGTY